MISLYLSRLRILSRDRANIFWTFLFPLILATLFNMALSNVYRSESFHSINIGLVDNHSYKYMDQLKDSLLNAKTFDSEKSINLFQVKEVELDKAKSLLEDNKIIGYIQPGPSMELVVKSSGMEQSIAKLFLERFSQSLNTIETMAEKGTQYLPQTLENIDNPINFLSLEFLSENPPDIILNYYYALIAMACLFGSFWGLREIVNIQADLSLKGARINIAPIHKMKMLISNMLASLTIHFTGILILLAYLFIGLKVSFGKDSLYIILTCLISCALGISLGAMAGGLTKKDESFKNSILVAIVMSSSFMAGMMMVEMKYIVTTKIPFLRYINPAHLITDAFYSLYYYDDYSNFLLNIVLIIAYSILFSLITYLSVRRKKYESI